MRANPFLWGIFFIFLFIFVSLYFALFCHFTLFLFFVLPENIGFTTPPLFFSSYAHWLYRWRRRVPLVLCLKLFFCWSFFVFRHSSKEIQVSLLEDYIAAFHFFSHPWSLFPCVRVILKALTKMKNLKKTDSARDARKAFFCMFMPQRLSHYSSVSKAEKIKWEGGNGWMDEGRKRTAFDEEGLFRNI